MTRKPHLMFLLLSAGGAASVHFLSPRDPRVIHRGISFIPTENCTDLPSGCFEPESYIRLEGLNIGEAIIMLGCSGLFWFVCLFLLEHRYLQRLWGKLITHMVVDGSKNTQEDEDVLCEEERIQDLFQRVPLKRIDIMNVLLLYVLRNAKVVGRVHVYSSSPPLKSTQVTYCFPPPVPGTSGEEVDVQRSSLPFRIEKM
ncbi:unnamed protein product [Darwinula stevensoni]|uniref:Uncharacterized protein n=1 Tax=Darwinula stevensoni TaxID=69355 RepID=A0A7R8XAR1_9CRUS|nr:unnamed protein product [Darwinula stevensoni]CAG0885788.1 unnamed protein product [Darwinula stevensoni]